MIKKFNYTKRQKILSEHVSVSVREISGALPVASISVSLEDYKLPPNADVVVEAYRLASYMRVPIGKAESNTLSRSFELSEFRTLDGVKFRIKVVGQSTGMKHDGPLLLAVADKITPSEGEGLGEESTYNSLIGYLPAELNGELWRLDFEDGPMILFEKNYWDDRHSISRSGWFFQLVLPSVFRECLRKALSDDFRETEGDDWRSMWLRFALSIPGDAELPIEDDIENWIDSKVAAFCRKMKMNDRFHSVVHQGGS
jgi:hypothetical protein